MSSLIAVILAASTATCPAQDPRVAILARHEEARAAHLKGDATILAKGIGERLVLADNGAVRTQTRGQVEEFFAGYLKQVRYTQWRDVTPPVVTIAPDGNSGWIAVAVEAAHVPRGDANGKETRFKSSWVATYSKVGCAWQMTAIGSNVGR